MGRFSTVEINNKAGFVAGRMREVWDFVREEMAESRETRTKAANRHRREVEYKIRGMDSSL